MVPFGVFFNPIAAMRVADGSQSSVYGRLCFVLKVVLDLGESVDKPNIEYPVAVKDVKSSLNRQA